MPGPFDLLRDPNFLAIVRHDFCHGELEEMKCSLVFEPVLARKFLDMPPGFGHTSSDIEDVVTQDFDSLDAADARQLEMTFDHFTDRSPGPGSLLLQPFV